MIVVAEGVTEDPGGEARSQQVAEGLGRVRDRIAAACASAGRVTGDVRLVVVTKTWPVTDVLHAVRLGVRDLGESRDDEAAAKAAQLAGEAEDLRWHFLGQLQSRKARSVASYATLVQSVDRVRAADALSVGAQRVGRTVGVLLQLSLDGDPERGGVTADGLLPLADHVAGLPGLRLDGLMAVLPRDSEARAAFAQVADEATRLRADHPAATVISAGMSGDLEDAVAAGSTMVRVGTAVFGPREPLLR